MLKIVIDKEEGDKANEVSSDCMQQNELFSHSLDIRHVAATYPSGRFAAEWYDNGVLSIIPGDSRTCSTSHAD